MTGSGLILAVRPLQYIVLGLEIVLGIAGLFLLAYILALLEKRVGILRRFFLAKR
jgi:hypothetical protein